MKTLFKTIRDMGILPLVAPQILGPQTSCPRGINPFEDAPCLGKALMDAPLPLVVLPFRNTAAEDMIRKTLTACPKLTLGVNGVTSIHQATRAQAAGARFIMTAGFNPKVVSWCAEHDMPIIPGCSTATELEAIMEMGLTTATFFPADQKESLGLLHNLHAAYPYMCFIPTGNLDAAAINAYLRYPAVLACATTCCTSNALLKQKDWSGITLATRQAIKAMLGMELAHVGVYPATESEDASQKLVSEFASLLDEPVTDIGAGIFVGSSIEVLRKTAPWNGHIAYNVSCVERACAHFALRGIHIDETSARYNDEGRLIFAYIADPIGNFGVHLRNR